MEEAREFCVEPSGGGYPIQESQNWQSAFLPGNGDNVQGRQLLTARRLLERGVRFVQVWHGNGQPWDSHDDIEINHELAFVD